jgi:CHASE3 domain sensor protein
MKIKQKFIIAFLGIALLVGVVGAAGFFAVQRFNHIISSGEEHFAPIIVAATEISSYAKRAEGHIMLFLALGDETDGRKFHQRIDSLYEQITKAESLARNQEARSILNTVSAKANDLFVTGDVLLEAYVKEKAQTGDFEIENHAQGIRKLNKIASEIREVGVKLAELEVSLQAGVTKEAVRVADAVSRFILIMGVFAIFIALLIGYYMGQSIDKNEDIQKIICVSQDVTKIKLERKV